MTPTLIMTRPVEQSESFASDLAVRWNGPLRIVHSPLIKIVPQAVSLDVPDAVVLTSANGVTAAEPLGLPKGLPAWCVGNRTAEAARQAGFEPITGPGTAGGLVAHIIEAQPTGTLAHIRGKHTRGGMRARLTSAGLSCVDVIAYDQREMPLSAEAITVLDGEGPVIFPLFSPRTAAILFQQGPFAAPVVVVAMSEAVQDAVDPAQAEVLAVAEKPDAAAMIEATLAVIERLVARA